MHRCLPEQKSCNFIMPDRTDYCGLPGLSGMGIVYPGVMARLFENVRMNVGKR